MKYYILVPISIFIAVNPLSVIAEYYQHWQTPDEINYFVDQATICARAVDERSRVVNRNPSVVPYQGARFSLIAELQVELEEITPSYINHVDGPLNGENTDFVFFNTNTWRAAAGINPYGFRRSTNGSIFEYGITTSNDLMNGWIIADLVNGFNELKQIVYPQHIINVKNVFSNMITAGISFSGYCSGICSQYNGSVYLGAPSGYNVLWNGQSPYLMAGTEYISMGRNGNTVKFVNDTKKYDNPDNIINFTTSLNFLDTPYINIYGYVVMDIKSINYSVNYCGNNISLSAALPAENAPVGQSRIDVDCFVTIRPPFTYPR